MEIQPQNKASTVLSAASSGQCIVHRNGVVTVDVTQDADSHKLYHPVEYCNTVYSF